MRRVIVHCGYPKAGSTAIQHYFGLNRGYFAEIGVLYPECAIPLFDGRWKEYGHHNLPLSFPENPQAGRFEPQRGSFAEVAVEWRASGAHTLVLSSEDFSVAWSSFPDLVYRKFQEFFPDCRLDVVFIVRNIVDFFESSLLQQRHEWRLGFHTDVMPTLRYEVDNLYRYNWYPTPLVNAERLLGKEHVHAIPLSPNIASSFCGLLGMDISLLPTENISNIVNSRITAKQAALLLNLSSTNEGGLFRRRIKEVGPANVFAFDEDFSRYNIFTEATASIVYSSARQITDGMARIPEPVRIPFDATHVTLSPEIFTKLERQRLSDIFGSDVLQRAPCEYLC